MGALALRPTELALGAGIRRELVRAAREQSPREACGLLLGRLLADRIAIERVSAARNRASEPDRFEIDARDLLRAEELADAEGLVLLGAWHSHIGRPAVPSDADRAGMPANWVMAIVALDCGGEAQVRAWRRTGELECELDIGAR